MINFYFLFSLSLFNVLLLLNFNSYSKFFKIEDKPDNKRKIHKKYQSTWGNINNCKFALLCDFLFDIRQDLFRKILWRSKKFLVF